MSRAEFIQENISNRAVALRRLTPAFQAKGALARTIYSQWGFSLSISHEVMGPDAMILVF